MKTWIYQVEAGLALRDSVAAAANNEGKKSDILRNMEKCLEEIMTHFEGCGAAIEAEELSFLIEGEADIIDNDDREQIVSFGFSDAEDLIDNRLEQFCDFCDKHKIWVAVPACPMR